ncbi:hypothetical protein HAX54_042658 [Datura stramonium]|uniref:F-box domain-containing protein n=1 Tax=Datura stramonium TaxID=4076 RepID=A0ABS8SML4_DATST|nr:hypothetical protein [Datura stramonium]
MNQRVWPSNSGRFAAFPFKKKQTQVQNRPTKNPFSNHSKEISPTTSSSSHSKSSNSSNQYNYNHDFSFSQLPYDVLLKIAATFTLPNLRAASLVCKSWCDALRPLRESMLFLRWGKRFKHGRGGVGLSPIWRKLLILSLKELLVDLR